MSSDVRLHRRCPNCDTDNSSEPALSYSWRDWLLRRCKTCQLVYLENPPDYSAFETSYAWEKNAQDRDARMRKEYPATRSMSRLWKTIRNQLFPKPNKLATRIRILVPPGPVIDIGCGGAGKASALPKHHEVIGIEISLELAREAEARLASRQGRVINMPAIQGLANIESGTASGVIMHAFLEHEIQPVELLTEVARVLRDDGVAIIKVPNYASFNRRIMGSRWCGFRFPGHVNYFTPTSLKAMIETVGLTTGHFGPFDCFPLSDNMWMSVRKS